MLSQPLPRRWLCQHAPAPKGGLQEDGCGRQCTRVVAASLRPRLRLSLLVTLLLGLFLQVALMPMQGAVGASRAGGCQSHELLACFPHAVAASAVAASAVAVAVLLHNRPVEGGMPLKCGWRELQPVEGGMPLKCGWRELRPVEGGMPLKCGWGELHQRQVCPSLRSMRGKRGPVLLPLKCGWGELRQRQVCPSLRSMRGKRGPVLLPPYSLARAASASVRAAKHGTHLCTAAYSAPSAPCIVLGQLASVDAVIVSLSWTLLAFPLPILPWAWLHDGVSRGCLTLGFTLARATGCYPALGMSVLRHVEG
eukprot:23284-Chlamydomonas_euryale.AAC.1